MTKAQLRARVLRQLTAQPEEDRQRKSEAIRRKLSRFTGFRRAKVVCCYVALPYEVQTWQLIQQMLTSGKRVVVPRVAGRHLRLSEVRDPATELRPGAFGVLEPRPGVRRPVSPKRVHMMLMPGLAFDRQGHRLGHGHGYFDRLCARLSPATTRVGLCFAFQLLSRLPVASHDQPVHRVVSA
jgi:5-formyltetrahydrofolate cyclo-ligase